MSGLGELLLGKAGEISPKTRDVKSNVNNNNISDNDKFNRTSKRSDNRDSVSPHRENQDDRSQSRNHRTFPNRIEKSKQEDDVQSDASSTDDYVRELLDPNDRPRNVWHVVEGPKKSHDEQISERDHQHKSKRDNEDYVGQYKDIKQELTIDHRVKREYDDESQKTTHLKREANLDISPDKRNSNDQHRAKLEPDDEDGKPNIVTANDRDDRVSRDISRERSSSRHGSSRHHADDRRGGRDRNNGGGRRSSSRRHRSHRKRDHSDDDDDYDRNRRRGGAKRSRSRSRSRSPLSTSSRRRDHSRSNSPPRNSRTVIVMQLSPRVATRDLEDYFNENIGHVHEVRLIMDIRTRRHKGVAYIEFDDSKSASRALSMNGRRLHGVPMTIQAVNSKSGDHSSSAHHYSTSSSRTNHHTSTSTYPSSRSLPPNAFRVYIGALNTGITDEMLKTIVEPFGPVLRVEVIKDRATGVSRGYAFVTYANVEDGQEAVKNLDGFELAGKCMRVSKSTEKGEH